MSQYHAGYIFGLQVLDDISIMSLQPIMQWMNNDELKKQYTTAHIVLESPIIFSLII